MSALRPYQVKAVNLILESLEENDSTLLVMPTGSGKTEVFSSVIPRFAKFGRVMVLAHRKELIDQAAKRIRSVAGLEVAVEMADQWADTGARRLPVVVSSVQTQTAGQGGTGRMTRFDPHEFSLLVIDEAHHAPAESYRRIIRHYRSNPKLKVIGCTATPDRRDEKAMGQVFESVAFNYEILDAINDGWLVPVRQRMIHVESMDFSGIRKTAGDLNGGELSELMERENNLHKVAVPTLEIAGDRRTLLFVVSVVQAERTAEICNRYKPDCARWVCGATPDQERKRIFEDYHAGAYQVLVNVGVVTEGIDVPGIELVSIARPTMSRALYAQMIGRGLRPVHGLLNEMLDAEPEDRRATIEQSAKPICEVLDFAGNAGRHKLITPADVLGGNYEDDVVELATEIGREQEGASDVQENLKQAQEQIKQRRIEIEQRKLQERSRRRSLTARGSNYQSVDVDAFGVIDVQPARLRGWDLDKQASHKQVELIGKLTKDRVDAAEWTRRRASQFIGSLINRRKQGLCTYGQARLLHEFSLPTDVTFSEASMLIDQMKARHYKMDPSTALSLLEGA